MMRRLSADDAACVVPLEGVGSHARDVTRVRARLEHARAVSEAREALEASLRARLPGLVQQLLGGLDSQAEAPFMALFEQELLRVRNASTLRVRLHPRWLNRVRELPAWQTLLASGAALLLEPDAELHEHDALFFSELGDIDARFSTRIAAFVEALLESRGSPADSQPPLSVPQVGAP